MRLRLLLTALGLLLTACVNDEANRYYSSEKYAQREPATVEILKSRPSRPFTVIADFQSRMGSAKSLQKKAAEIGADAVIVTFVGGWANAESTTWANNDTMSNSYTRVLGTAIKYK